MAIGVDYRPYDTDPLAFGYHRRWDPRVPRHVVQDIRETQEAILLWNARTEAFAEAMRRRLMEAVLRPERPEDV